MAIKGNYPNGKDCSKICDRYVSVACHKFDSPPYVCNNCKDKKLCNNIKEIRQQRGIYQLDLANPQFEITLLEIIRFMNNLTPIKMVYAIPTR